MSKINSRDVLYCDTDSIMYVKNDGGGDESQEPILPTGNFLGDLTDELPMNVEVTEYYSAGPKFYLLMGKNSQTGAPYTVFKLKGVSLNKSTEDVINVANVKSLILGEIGLLNTPFSSIRRHKETGELKNTYCEKSCRVVNSKRLFYQDGNSVPYGYIDL